MLPRRAILSFIAATCADAYAQAPRTSPKLAKLQQELTDMASQVAKDMRVNLDFSHGSVKSAETILAELHVEQRRTKSTEGVFGIAMGFGAYIVTVIERNTEPGLWEKDHPSIGENSFPFTWRGSTIFPVGWCLKRIMDGPQDNVWIKYQQYVLKGPSK